MERTQPLVLIGEPPTDVDRLPDDTINPDERHRETHLALSARPGSGVVASESPELDETHGVSPVPSVRLRHRPSASRAIPVVHPVRLRFCHRPTPSRISTTQPLP